MRGEIVFHSLMIIDATKLPRRSLFIHSYHFYFSLCDHVGNAMTTTTITNTINIKYTHENVICVYVDNYDTHTYCFFRMRPMLLLLLVLILNCVWFDRFSVPCSYWMFSLSATYAHCTAHTFLLSIGCDDNEKSWQQDKTISINIIFKCRIWCVRCLLC